MTPDAFRALVLANPINATILDRLPSLGLDQAYLVAGCLYQAVWNARDGRDPGWGVKDYDLFYYDPDTSWEAEDAVIRRAAALYADLGVEVEVRNQARVHLWYPQRFGTVIPPLASSQDGIAGFLVRCTCVGVRRGGGALLWAGRSGRRHPVPQSPHRQSASVPDQGRQLPRPLALAR